MDARRFRGLIGMSAIWGVALAGLATTSLAIGLATGLVPASIFGARELVAVAVRGLAAGAVGGGLFAWVLSRRERGELLSTLSPRRIALWGALAAGSVPPIFALILSGPALPIGVLAAGSVLFAAGGGAMGVALVRVARRTPSLPVDDRLTTID